MDSHRNYNNYGRQPFGSARRYPQRYGMDNSNSRIHESPQRDLNKNWQNRGESNYNQRQNFEDAPYKRRKVEGYDNHREQPTEEHQPNFNRDRNQPNFSRSEPRDNQSFQRGRSAPRDDRNFGPNNYRKSEPRDPNFKNSQENWKANSSNDWNTDNGDRRPARSQSVGRSFRSNRNYVHEPINSKYFKNYNNRNGGRFNDKNNGDVRNEDNRGNNRNYNQRQNGYQNKPQDNQGQENNKTRIRYDFPAVWSIQYSYFNSPEREDKEVKGFDKDKHEAISEISPQAHEEVNQA